ncbi:MAG: hypothetical protein J2P48_18260 [Alphaproteobacteria bacterium]|nr:hypothetical protein [Alphaproteobacteria bacterium]
MSNVIRFPVREAPTRAEEDDVHALVEECKQILAAPEPADRRERQALLDRHIRGEFVFPGQRYDPPDALMASLQNLAKWHGVACPCEECQRRPDLLEAAE